MKRFAFGQSAAGCLAAILLCLGSGCVRSIQPILKDEQVITDDRLRGSWVSGDGKTSAEVTASDDHKGYKVLVTDGDGNKAQLLVQLGKIGDMTIAESTADPQPLHNFGGVYAMHLLPLYSFVVVRQAAPRLVLYTMDSDWLKKYVEAHPGELAIIPPHSNDSGVVVTAPTDDFQAFLLRHAKDAGAFGSDSTFVHPGDPTTRPSTMPVNGP